MTIEFNEIARRYDIIKDSDSTASREDITNIVMASVSMTASEFDAVVLQAKVDIVVQKALSEELPTRSGVDMTLDILRAKYNKH